MKSAINDSLGRVSFKNPKVERISDIFKYFCIFKRTNTYYQFEAPDSTEMFNRYQLMITFVSAFLKCPFDKLQSSQMWLRK